MYYALNVCIFQVRPCGPMDMAPDFGSGDCRFESCHGRFLDSLCIIPLMYVYIHEIKFLLLRRPHRYEGPLIVTSSVSVSKSSRTVRGRRRLNQNFRSKKSTTFREGKLVTLKNTHNPQFISYQQLHSVMYS